MSVGAASMPRLWVGQEVETISFEYDNDWNVMTLSDENGTPYEFYLAAGKHTLRLEATLGGTLTKRV